MVGIDVNVTKYLAFPGAWTVPKLSREEIVIVHLCQCRRVELKCREMLLRNFDERFAIKVLAEVSQIAPSPELDRPIDRRLAQTQREGPPVIVTDRGRLDIATPPGGDCPFSHLSQWNALWLGRHKRVEAGTNGLGELRGQSLPLLGAIFGRRVFVQLVTERPANMSQIEW